MPDIYTKQGYTTPPGEQSPLNNALNPNSLNKLWKRQLPLHEEGARHRINMDQLAAAVAKLSKTKPALSQEMFPFKIFTPPLLWQQNIAWTQDAHGPANWRTFQVWTGQATAWLLQTPSAGAPSGANLAVPQLVYVARTGGYNNAGTMSNNTAESGPVIIGENYKENYSAIELGNYPANPGNPNNTGPAAYAAPFNELMFTAPPSSVAVFWISWDTNAGSGTAASPYVYTLALNGNSYASFPVLHFGGLDSNGNYFGDLNSTTGPHILGSLTTGQFDAGTPPQLFPFYPTNAFASPYNAASQTPEGFIIVGAIVVGAQGAANWTGADGSLQIFQGLFNNLATPISRSQFRGAYSNTAFYFPGEMVTQNSSTFINATTVALQNVNPSTIQSNSPFALGPTFANTNFATGNDNAGDKNLWMPLGSSGSAISQTFQVINESPTLLNCYTLDGGTVGNTVIQVLKPNSLQNSNYVFGQYGLLIQANALTISGVVSPNKRQTQLNGAGGAIWNEVIWPGYSWLGPSNANAVITAISIPANQQINGIAWQDQNIDNRKWMKEVAACTNNGNAVSLTLIDATATYPTANALNFSVV